MDLLSELQRTSENTPEQLFPDDVAEDADSLYYPYFDRSREEVSVSALRQNGTH